MHIASHATSLASNEGDDGKRKAEKTPVQLTGRLEQERGQQDKGEHGRHRRNRRLALHRALPCRCHHPFTYVSFSHQSFKPFFIM